MINILQYSTFAKLDKSLPSIEKSLNQHSSTFTYISFLIINCLSKVKVKT